MEDLTRTPASRATTRRRARSTSRSSFLPPSASSSPSPRDRRRRRRRLAVVYVAAVVVCGTSDPGRRWRRRARTTTDERRDGRRDGRRFSSDFGLRTSPSASTARARVARLANDDRVFNDSKRHSFVRSRVVRPVPGATPRGVSRGGREVSRRRAVAARRWTRDESNVERTTRIESTRRDVARDEARRGRRRRRRRRRIAFAEIVNRGDCESRGARRTIWVRVRRC